MTDILPAETMKKLSLLVDIVERKDRQFSISVLGSGGGYGATTSLTMPSITMQSIQTFFEEIIIEIKNAGYKEVILHYNNLDVFDSQSIQRLFNSIRDFIQTRDVNFVFIGDLKVPQSLNQIKRVVSIMSDPIFIENISLEDLKSLLSKRIDNLSIAGLVAEKPYEDNVISKLYTLYDGNLRFILNSLSTAFNEMIVDTPLILNSELLIKVLADTSRKRWLNKLTDLEREVLMLILNEDEITNKTIAEKLAKHGQNMSKITNKLLEMDAIRIKKIEGRKKFFSVVHAIKWILLEKGVKSQQKENETAEKISKEIQSILK